MEKNKINTPNIISKFISPYFKKKDVNYPVTSKPLSGSKNDSDLDYSKSYSVHTNDSYTSYSEEKEINKKEDYINEFLLLFGEKDKNENIEKSFSILDIFNSFFRILFILYILHTEYLLFRDDFITRHFNKDDLSLIRKSAYFMISMNVIYINFSSQKRIVNHIIIEVVDLLINYLFFLNYSDLYYTRIMNSSLKKQNIIGRFLFYIETSFLNMSNSMSSIIIPTENYNLFQSLDNISKIGKKNTYIIENNFGIKPILNLLYLMSFIQGLFFSLRCFEIITFICPFIYVFSNINYIKEDFKISNNEDINNILKLLINYNIIYVLILYCLILKYRKDNRLPGRSLSIFFAFLSENNFSILKRSSCHDIIYGDIEDINDNLVKKVIFVSIILFMLVMPYICDFKYDFKLYSWFDIYIHFFFMSLNIFYFQPSCVKTNIDIPLSYINLIHSLFVFFNYTYLILSDSIITIPSKFIFSSFLECIIKIFIFFSNLLCYYILYGLKEENHNDQEKENDVMKITYSLYFISIFTTLLSFSCLC